MTDVFCALGILGPLWVGRRREGRGRDFEHARKESKREDRPRAARKPKVVLLFLGE